MRSVAKLRPFKLRSEAPQYYLMILIGFRYLASSIPLSALIGVAIGVGLIFSFLLFSLSRNPSISNILIR